MNQKTAINQETTINQDELALRSLLNQTFTAFDRALSLPPPDLSFREIGTVKTIGSGIVQVAGLPQVKAEEVVRFPGGGLGMVLDTSTKQMIQ